MTEVNTALADGHFRKGGRLIPNLQFRRKLAHEMTENTIRVENVDSGIPRRSICTPAIVSYTLLKAKNHEGSYDMKAKKSKHSNRNIKNRDAPTLKLATNGLEVLVNAPWDSLCAIDVSSNIKLRLLLMHKYYNQLVTQFFTIFDRYTIYCISIALHLFSSVLVRIFSHCLCLLYDYLKNNHTIDKDNGNKLLQVRKRTDVMLLIYSKLCIGQKS